jgi:hypothetical protein
VTEFVLKLNLANHEHHAAAQHAIVREMLGLAQQQIGSGSSRKGELTIPLWNVQQGVNRHITVGSWEFTETETRNPVASEAAPHEAA